MSLSWKRQAAIALAVAGLTATGFISGCKTDVERADEKAAASMGDATLALTEMRPEAGLEMAADITSAKGTSVNSQIDAEMLAGQADLEAARLLMSGPASSTESALAFRAVVEGKRAPHPSAQKLAPDELAELRGIQQRQIRIRQLASQMAALVEQLAINNISIAGARSLDPTKAREALQQAAALAQTGSNGVWISGAAPLASLDGLKARESDLKKQVADLTSQRDDLNSKRGHALQEAAKFDQQSDATNGAASVGFFTQAANQRKEAADDQTTIAQLDARLEPLQQDLSVVQLQQKAISQILAGYSDQSQQLENGWRDVQGHIDATSNFSKDLLDKAEPPAPAPQPPAADASGASTPPPNIEPMPHSLAGLAAALDAEVKEVESLRSKAISLLNSASAHNDKASTLAAGLSKTLMTESNAVDSAKLPERRAWQEQMSLLSPAIFKLRQAAVQDAMGRLYADYYSELGQRNSLGEMLHAAIKQAGLTAPPTVTASVPQPGTVPVDVDSKIRGFEGDLRSDQPQYQQIAAGLNELAANQTSPAALLAITGAQGDVAFHWAAGSLNDVINNAGQSDLAPLLVNIGHSVLMATDYAQSQFAALQGKQQESDADMKAAVEEHRTLADANAQNLLPSILPAGLAFPLKRPGVPSPASAVPHAPAAAPAVAPAAAH